MKKQAALQRRQVASEPLVRRRPVAEVEIDVRRVDHRLPVLDEEALLRPLRQGLAHVPPGAIGFVPSQPLADVRARPHVHGHVQIAAILGLGVERGLASYVLLEITQEIVGAREEETSDRARRRVAPAGLEPPQDRGLRLLPHTAEEAVDAPPSLDVGQCFGSFFTKGEASAKRDERLLALRHGLPGAGHLRRLEAQGPRDLEPVSLPQRLDEVPRLHARAQDEVHQAEAARDRVERVHAEAIRLGDLLGAALHESHSQRGGPDAIDDEPEERPERRPGGAHTDGSEHAAEDLGALIDPSRSEQVLCGGALVLHLLGRGRALRRVQVGPGRLDRPPRHLERPRKAHPQASDLVR